MEQKQRIVRAISVSIGDEIELIDGAHQGFRAKVADTRPPNVPYATHIKVKGRGVPVHFRNKWVPIKMWRKVD